MTQQLARTSLLEQSYWSEIMVTNSFDDINVSEHNVFWELLFPITRKIWSWELSKTCRPQQLLPALQCSCQLSWVTSDILARTAAVELPGCWICPPEQSLLVRRRRCQKIVRPTGARSDTESVEVAAGWELQSRVDEVSTRASFSLRDSQNLNTIKFK